MSMQWSMSKNLLCGKSEAICNIQSWHLSINIHFYCLDRWWERNFMKSLIPLMLKWDTKDKDQYTNNTLLIRNWLCTHILQEHVANRSWTFTAEANQLNGVIPVHKSLVQLSFDWLPQQRSMVKLSVYCEQSSRNQPTNLSKQAN